MASTAALKQYEREAAVCLEAASIAMKKEIPNYGEAEHQIARAQQAIKYARQIQTGKYQGEQY
jgi:hypothetical protein